MNYSALIRLNGVCTIKYYHIHLHQKSTNKQIKTKNMTENKTSKMNLDHERKIVELQERVNKLEDLCFTTKEILNQEYPLQNDAPEPVTLLQTCGQTHLL